MGISEKCVTTEGIVLQTPQINFDRAKDVPRNASINMRDKKVVEAIPLEKWIIFHTERDTDTARTFVNNLRKAAGWFGMQIRNPRTFAIKRPKAEDFCE